MKLSILQIILLCLCPGFIQTGTRDNWPKRITNIETYPCNHSPIKHTILVGYVFNVSCFGQLSLVPVWISARTKAQRDNFTFQSYYMRPEQTHSWIVLFLVTVFQAFSRKIFSFVFWPDRNKPLRFFYEYGNVMPSHRVTMNNSTRTNEWLLNKTTRFARNCWCFEILALFLKESIVIVWKPESLLIHLLIRSYVYVQHKKLFEISFIRFTF